MKTKSFQKYLEKRLNQQEINELEQQANIEIQSLQQMQKDIARALAEYLAQEKIGFNELVRRLGISPTQVLKIQKGQANITLSTLAHISALLKTYPHIVFKDKKHKH